MSNLIWGDFSDGTSDNDGSSVHFFELDDTPEDFASEDDVRARVRYLGPDVYGLEPHLRAFVAGRIRTLVGPAHEVPIIATWAA